LCLALAAPTALSDGFFQKLGSPFGAAKRFAEASFKVGEIGRLDIERLGWRWVGTDVRR